MVALTLLESARRLERGKLAGVTLSLLDPGSCRVEKRPSDVDCLDVDVPRRSEQLLLGGG